MSPALNLYQTQTPHLYIWQCHENQNYTGKTPSLLAQLGSTYTCSMYTIFNNHFNKMHMQMVN